MRVSSHTPRARAGRVGAKPQRDVGRRKVEALLKAAESVFSEHGFAAATMSEIAARAGALVGSLYRFFPDKDALADALFERYLALAGEAYDTAEARAADMDAVALADFLLDFMVTLHAATQALGALLDARGQGESGWARVRSWAVERISRLLRVHTPALDESSALDIATLALNVMKLMSAMTMEGTAPTRPGAVQDLRDMFRRYLASRLARDAETSA